MLLASWKSALDSAGLLDEVLLTQHSIFQAVLDGTSIDLMAKPWVEARSDWTQGNDYSQPHAVAAAAQQRAVQWLAYESVRAPGERCAVAFDVHCLHEPKPSLDSTIQRWVCKASRHSVMFSSGRVSHVWEF